MNITTSLAALTLCLGFSMAAGADDEHHPEKAKATTPAEATAPAAKATIDPKAIEANAAKLQSQAKRIAKAKPGPERDKLMAEHVRSLHESMEMARGMMPEMALEHCMDASEDRSGHKKKHMDMMEHMMKGGTPNP